MRRYLTKSINSTTSLNFLQEEGLEYATIGNLPGHKYNSTFCPRCGKILIKRVHYKVVSVQLEDGRCKSCGHSIPGVWK